MECQRATLRLCPFRSCPDHCRSTGTQATIELCNITVTEPGVTAMNAHRRQLETDFHLEGETAVKAYETVKADVEKAGVDCTEGSADRQQTDAVIAVYSGT